MSKDSSDAKKKTGEKKKVVSALQKALSTPAAQRTAKQRLLLKERENRAAQRERRSLKIKAALEGLEFQMGKLIDAGHKKFQLTAIA